MSGNVEVSNDVEIFGNAKVYDNVQVSGNMKVSGNSEVCGNAQVSKNGDILVFENHLSGGRYITYTRSNKMWKDGGFYGTGQELIEVACRDSNNFGALYKAYVGFVEALDEQVF